MEGDTIERDPVQRCLGLGDALEDVAGQPLSLRVQPRPLQQAENLRVVPVLVVMLVMVIVMRMRGVHHESLANKGPTPSLLKTHLQPVHAHFRDGVADYLGRDSSIHQSRHRHVARDPGRWVEM